MTSINDMTSTSNNNSYIEEEIITINKPKTNIFKKILGILKKNKKRKTKKDKGKKSVELENEANNYNTVTSSVSFNIPSLCVNGSNLCSSSTTTARYPPNQGLQVPSILNRNMFIAPSDDNISEADTEITLVDPVILAENKKNNMKKKKLLSKAKHCRRHSWQYDSFNEHLEDPRNCRTVNNIKEILDAENRKVYLHKLSTNDIETILDEELAKEIKKSIPCFYRETCNNWYLEYNLAEHGSSLTTFYECQMDCESPIVVAITDSYGDVFGAYLNEPFNPTITGFTGNRECFLWKLTNEGVKVYRATSINDYFMMADQDFIAMGVDENGVFGLFLDNLLLNGESSPCDTYLNEVLSSKRHFECSSLEVWSLQYE